MHVELDDLGNPAWIFFPAHPSPNSRLSSARMAGAMSGRASAKTQAFYGLRFEGQSFDCGSKVGFLAANVSYALARPDIALAMRAELKRLLDEG